MAILGGGGLRSHLRFRNRVLPRDRRAGVTCPNPLWHNGIAVGRVFIHDNQGGTDAFVRTPGNATIHSRCELRIGLRQLHGHVQSWWPEDAFARPRGVQGPSDNFRQRHRKDRERCLRCVGFCTRHLVGTRGGKTNARVYPLRDHDIFAMLALRRLYR